MQEQLVNYLENEIQKIPYSTFHFQIVKNEKYYFEAILEAHNCEIKIEESTKQILLYISKKDNNWISMYWLCKYLNIPYKILPIRQLKGNYIKLIRKQIDYFCNFIKTNIEILDDFYKNDIYNDINAIREIAKEQYNNSHK